MDITANVLLAAGASPAMVASSDECEAFAAHCASALLVNLGTLTSSAVASQRLAVQAAHRAQKPVVLDPVACGSTPYRTAACVEALRLRPAVVRGNAGEVVALAAAAGVLQQKGEQGEQGEGGGTEGGEPLVRGVDSAVGAQDPRVEAAARALARAFGCVVAVSGAVDLVVWPGAAAATAALRVSNGVEMLTRVTAAGCSLTALIAAFVAVAAAEAQEEAGGGGGQRLAAATAAALAAFGVAAELALERAAFKGPGSLRAGLLDALYLMTKDEFLQRAKIA